MRLDLSVVGEVEKSEARVGKSLKISVFQSVVNILFVVSLFYLINTKISLTITFGIVECVSR